MTACTQPGCTGTLEPDGYCSACGLAPAPAATGSAGEAQGGGSGATGSGPRSVPVPVPRSGATRSGPDGRRAVRGRLGAGLIEIPPVPALDPSSAVLSDPQVPESKRICSSCEHPVGRQRDGRPGRTEGFCARCGHEFSYSPKLQPGELVGGQYEVLGCLAHGGLGWVYLATDHNVSDKWVVLKGLLDSGDADAQQAAVAERRFLAEVEHPNIVRIINFVPHQDRTGATTGYIVMEYVGGQSLRQIVLERRKARESLPLTHALAHAIEVLPALGYLHSRGLLYCDFKPDNVIQVEEQVRLIDLGGVRRMDDQDSPVYGTVGYQAPEIGSDGPSVSSDLYTVGRALAVLTFEFNGYTTTYKHSLPDQADVPLLAEQESFYRLLRRATDPVALARFTSAQEMSEQLTGVLREVLAVADDQPRPALSTLFSPERQAIGADAVLADGPSTPAASDIVAGLPVPVVDGADPAAGYLATLSALDPERQAAELAGVASGAPGTPQGIADSVEVHLALARARIDAGDLDGAEAVLTQLIDQDRADWRVTWYQGLRSLAAGQPAEAQARFDAVYDALPGELAPKLAIALAAEAAAAARARNGTATGAPDPDTAARLFRVVWTVDRSYVSAALGLARVRLAAGDRAGAVDVLATVPETSSHYIAAQIAAVRAQISGQDPARLAPADLQEAGSRLQRLRLDTQRQESLAIEILGVALGWVTRSAAPGAAVTGAGEAGGATRLLDCELNERALRFGLEKSYRALARLASGDDRRVELVDLANDVRPRTRF